MILSKNSRIATYHVSEKKLYIYNLLPISAKRYRNKDKCILVSDPFKIRNHDIMIDIAHPQTQATKNSVYVRTIRELSNNDIFLKI